MGYLEYIDFERHYAAFHTNVLVVKGHPTMQTRLAYAYVPNVLVIMATCLHAYYK